MAHGTNIDLVLPQVKVYPGHDMPRTLSQADIAAISRALSAPRFDRYLTETGGDAAAALALYDWNARISAALLHPLHVMEVALRNGVADAIAAEHGPDWHMAPMFIGSLPRPAGTHYNPRSDLVTTTDKVRRELVRKQPAHASRPVVVPAGKVVAELKLMFWVGMLTARHDARIWTRHLATGFPGAPTAPVGGRLPRRILHERADAVRTLRNRIAHHEPVFGRDLRAEYAQVLRVIRFRCPVTARWVHTTQGVTALLAQRP